MTRNEKKTAIENMAERFMSISDLEGKSMAIMVIENLFQHRKKVIYALKEITAGDMLKVKDCKHVCLFCEYYDMCKEEAKANEHEICKEK